MAKFVYTWRCRLLFFFYTLMYEAPQIEVPLRCLLFFVVHENFQMWRITRLVCAKDRHPCIIHAPTWAGHSDPLLPHGHLV